MTEGLLSARAAALYEHLVLNGPKRLDLPDAAVLAELDAIGFTCRSPCHPGMVLAVQPEVAFGELLASFAAELSARHALIGAALAEVVARHRETAHTVAEGRLVEVLTDQVTIKRFAGELMTGAHREACEFAVSTHGPGLTEVVGPMEPSVSEGVRHRCVYARNCLDSELGRQIVRLSRAAGEEQRFFYGWMTSVRIADDDVALVRLAAGAALLVRSRPLVGLMRCWFDLVWERSSPPEDGRPRLTARELAVLQLQAAGHKDAAIARALGINVRTVRRHVATILAELGVGTRFEAGVEAVRRGWLPVLMEASG